MPTSALGSSAPATCESSAEGPLEAPPVLRLMKVAKVLRDLQADAIVEEGAITLEVDESLHIAADEDLLTAALGSLLHQAIKVSRSPARIVLRARAEDDGVVVELENDCAGLPPASWESLFESADENHRSPGLALSKRIIERLGGSIRLNSEPGGSCAVLLSFPLVKYPTNAAHALASRGSRA